MKKIISPNMSLSECPRGVLRRSVPAKHTIHAPWASMRPYLTMIGKYFHHYGKHVAQSSSKAGSYGSHHIMSCVA